MKNTKEKSGILVMVSKEEKENIEKRAKENGFTSVSEYIRVMSLKGTVVVK